MKKFVLLLACLSFGTATSQAQFPIEVSSVATVTPTQVTVDLYANTNGIELRGFGLQVKFPAHDLAPVAGGRFSGHWYLRDDQGFDHPHTDITFPSPDCVRIVGGYFDGSDPFLGVNGPEVPLATVVFDRLTGADPVFLFELAGHPPFVSFSDIFGTDLDPDVVFSPTDVRIPSDDSDGDGLPDEYELAFYGDLTTSDGTGDHDGDGDNDLTEWIRGTDPTDPSSRFHFEVIREDDGSTFVLWDGELGRVYDLEWSPDLEDFQLIASDLPGLGDPILWFDENALELRKGFYRIRTRIDAPVLE